MNKGVNKEFIIFLVIMAVAVFFRFYQLDLVPPGLWPDEAANGVDALKVLDECRNVEMSKCLSKFKIFYPANNGREGLFINLQAFSIAIFRVEPWALRLVSAIMGVLTIAGLYLLTRYIFNWRIAAVSSFFLAISFWHVNFSRIGFRAIMLPLILVWGFYFLWRGLRNGRLRDFFIAGLITGLGFYTYFSFRIAPLIGLILFWNYWSYIKKDFSFSKYEHTRNHLLRGFALLVLTTIIIALPMMVYFYVHPDDFLKREGRPISVFAQEKPIKELGISIVRTLGMFNFTGDQNQRHNIPGWPELSLPIGILFIAGFLKELFHWLSRKHGPPSPKGFLLRQGFGGQVGGHSHFSTVHTFLFSWFLVMLLPGFLSIEAPHALRVIGVVPVVMIFAAIGFWWFVNLISRLYRVYDPHYQFDKQTYNHEAKILISITALVFLISLGFLEYSRYFISWGLNPKTKEAFTQKYIDIAEYLNMIDVEVPKYILVNEGDVLVDKVPNNAQTIKYLTSTHNQQCSIQNQIYYLPPNQLSTFRFPAHYFLIPLATDHELETTLINRHYLYKTPHESFTIFSK